MPINQSPTSDRSSTNSSTGSGVNLFGSSSHRAQLQITNPKTDKSDQYQSMTINQDALSKLCKQKNVFKALNTLAQHRWIDSFWNSAEHWTLQCGTTFEQANISIFRKISAELFFSNRWISAEARERTGFLVKPFFIRRAGEKLPAASRRCSGCLTIGAFSPLSITDFSLQNSSISKFVVFFYSFHPAGFFVFHRLVQPIYFIHSLGDYRFELSIDWFDLFCVSAFFHSLSKETPTAVASILLFPLDRPAEFIKFPKFPQTSSIFARVSLAQAAPKPSDSVLNRLQNI